MFTLILPVELIVLYFLSRWLTQSLYNLFFLTFRHRSVAVMLITLLQFPGTVVHELAHLFTAGILGVKAGKLTLVPESIRGDPSASLRTSDIRLGSVSIAPTGPIRRYAIGLAPIFVGTLTLTTIAYFLHDAYIQVIAFQVSLFSNPQFYVLIALFYLMFAISNAMFSSKEDLQGFAPFAIFIVALFIILYFLGVRINLTGASLSLFNRIITTLVNSIGVVLGVNIVLLLLTWFATKILEKIFRRKLIV